jgi:hypothetical protein
MSENKIEGQGHLNPKGGGPKPLQSHLMRRDDSTLNLYGGNRPAQNGGETRLDFSNGASNMMLETILNLSLGQIKWKK